MIKLMNWADVEKALVHVKNALGVDDANLLRAALVLRGHGVTMTEYQQTLPAGESAGRDKSNQEPAVRAMETKADMMRRFIHSRPGPDMTPPTRRPDDDQETVIRFDLSGLPAEGKGGAMDEEGKE